MTQRFRADAWIFAGVLAVALLMRVALWAPVWTPDCDRFVRQGEDLAQGKAFFWKGRPAVDLPPGYPVFIALLLKLGVGSDWLSSVNMLLGSLTCGLLFLVVRRVASLGAALFVALALALNPWVARQCSYVMSETLTAFLCVLWLYVVWTPTWGKGYVRAVLGGFLLSFLPLTAPGLLFVCAFGGLVLLFRLRRSPLPLALLLLSAGITMAPWQWHCVRATGHLVPTVFMPTEDLSSHLGVWLRTWSAGEDDIRFAWHPEQLGGAPARAFRSSAERERIVTLAVIRAPYSLVRLEAEVATIAAERRQEFPLEIWARSALRSVRLWTRVPRMPFFQTGDAGRAFLGLLYLAYTLGCVWGAVRGCRRGDGWATALVLGTVAYTLISGYTALGEARRSIPFLFLLLPLAVDRDRSPDLR